MAPNAHHHPHLRVARHDDLQEFHHNSEGPLQLSRFKREELGRRKKRGMNFVPMHSILQLKVCLVSVAAMACGYSALGFEPPTTGFSFDRNFSQNDFIILQDASVVVEHITLNSGTASQTRARSGRALYSTPVQLFTPATKSVASFQTSFSFELPPGENCSKGDGFAFGFFPDDTSDQSSGDVLPIVNTTTRDKGSTEQLSSGFDRAFIIEFGTQKGMEIGAHSGNYIEVTWNRMVSLHATDVTAVPAPDLVGGDHSAVVSYSFPLRKLSVWMTTSGAKIDPELDLPVLELRDLDLSMRLLPSMYVGFIGNVRAGVKGQHAISAWKFSTTTLIHSLTHHHGPAGFRSRDKFRSLSSSESCDGECRAQRRRKKTILLAVCLVLFVAGTIAVALFCLIRCMKRRAEPPFFQVQPSPSDSPRSFQHRKLSTETPRDSLSFKPLLPARASLSSKPPVSPSRCPDGLYPPRPSLSSKPSFSPAARASLKSFLEPMKLMPTMEKFKHTRNSSVGSGVGSGSKRLTTTQELDALTSIGPRRYTYGELKQATTGFREMLGKGGFGTVYKGYLPNGNERGAPVAVKVVAADSEQGEREFLAEVSIISGLRHRNLVQILGWCHERGKLLLIYDFMENRSLDKHLYDTNPGDPVLPWVLRYKAICQVASALTYLHDEAEQKVIHRDIKSSNVLLDAKFNARLGDFGLARMSENSQVADTTVLQGTLGYLAPELVHTGKATTKTDVFSFGTLILEVICGKKPLDCSRRAEGQHLLLGDWVWECFEAGRLADAVDPQLREAVLLDGQHDIIEDMTRALQVGLMCVHPHTSCRPPIRFARQMLVGDLALPKLPSQKPTLSFGAGEFLIPMEDLLRRSMNFIASAMETQDAENPTLESQKSSAAEFDAPWKVKMSGDEHEELQDHNSDCSLTFPRWSELQPVAR